MIWRNAVNYYSGTREEVEKYMVRYAPRRPVARERIEDQSRSKFAKAAECFTWTRVIFNATRSV